MTDLQRIATSLERIAASLDPKPFVASFDGISPERKAELLKEMREGGPDHIVYLQSSEEIDFLVKTGNAASKRSDNSLCTCQGFAFTHRRIGDFCSKCGKPIGSGTTPSDYVADNTPNRDNRDFLKAITPKVGDDEIELPTGEVVKIGIPWGYYSRDNTPKAGECEHDWPDSEVSESGHLVHCRKCGMSRWIYGTEDGAA